MATVPGYKKPLVPKPPVKAPMLVSGTAEGAQRGLTQEQYNAQTMLAKNPVQQQVFKNQFPQFTPPVPPSGILGPVKSPNLSAAQYQSMFQNYQAQQNPAFANQNMSFANAPRSVAPGWNPTNPYITSNPWNTMNPYRAATFSPYAPSQWAPSQIQPIQPSYPAGSLLPADAGGVVHGRKEGIWATFQNPDVPAAGGLGGGGYYGGGGGGGGGGGDQIGGEIQPGRVARNG